MALLLDLKTQGTHETVKINGSEYALTDFENLTPLDQLRISRLGKRVLRITNSDSEEDLTDAEAKDLESLTTDVFYKIAGDIPEEVRERILATDRLKIFNAYFLAYAETLGAEKQDEEKSQSGSGESSPDFSDSTEETPNDG